MATTSGHLRDGTVRRFDYVSGVFESVLQRDDAMLCHLALAPAKVGGAGGEGQVFVASSTGDILVVDPRSARVAMEIDAHDRKIATVDAQDAQVLVTASNDQTVKVWDLRKAGGAKPKHVHLLQHTLAVTSAYFGPASGGAGARAIVTTCNDNLLRFWRPGAGHAHEVTQAKHNNNTGRYITNFRAVWDRKTGAVLIGNMDKKLDIFDGATGKLLGSAAHELCSAIPAVNVAHDTLPLVASGNGSGYVNVWGHASR